MLSRNLEKSLHRALARANDRRHEFATLEHLLLALTEDEDAVATLRGCRVDLDRLHRRVLEYVDNELSNLVAAYSDDAKPTMSFQRVLQRAAIHVQFSAREEVTGANVLVAMFAERESHAVNFLQEQGMSRFDAVNYNSHGITKAPEGLNPPIIQNQQGGTTIQQLISRLNNTPTSRETPAIDETKLIAAILCARMILPEDTATDPIGTTVDLYERILAELRARDHGRPGNQMAPEQIIGQLNEKHRNIVLRTGEEFAPYPLAQSSGLVKELQLRFKLIEREGVGRNYRLTPLGKQVKAALQESTRENG